MRSRRFSSLRACLLDLLGHLRVGDRLVELVDLGAAVVVLAELLLDRAHLLAQQVLALPLVDRALRPLADLARELAAPRCGAPGARARLSSRVSRSNVSRMSCFSAGLMSIRPAMKSASAPARSTPCSAAPISARHLRQQARASSTARCFSARARLDLGIRRRLVGDQLDARDQERQAVRGYSSTRKRCSPWQMRWCDAVRRRDVAHDRGGGADPVQVVGARARRRSGRFCSSTPTCGRSVRTASCAARIELARRARPARRRPGTARRCAPARRSARPRATRACPTTPRRGSGRPDSGRSFAAAPEMRMAGILGPRLVFQAPRGRSGR